MSTRIDIGALFIEVTEDYLTKRAVLLSARKKPVGNVQEARPDNRGNRLRAGITTSPCCDLKHGELFRSCIQRVLTCPQTRCGGFVVLLPG